MLIAVQPLAASPFEKSSEAQTEDLRIILEIICPIRDNIRDLRIICPI